MTFAELKAALDATTTEQLSAQVRWCSDETSGVVTSVWLMPASCNKGYGWEDVSAYELDDTEDEIAPRIPAGTPVLMVDG